PTIEGLRPICAVSKNETTRSTMWNEVRLFRPPHSLPCDDFIAETMPGTAIPQRPINLPSSEFDRTPLTPPSGTLNYGDLRQSMLGHADWLAEGEGVGPGDGVAIALPKTIATVELIFGILAAGAAYIPLQFQGPPARLARILASLRPKLF